MKDYDYSLTGAYFITLCTQGKRNILCEIGPVGQGLCSCRLLAAGEIVQDELSRLETRYDGMKIDKYVIMPNHLHMIVIIDQPGERREQSPLACAKERPQPGGHVCPRPTVSDFVCGLKSITTKQCNRTCGTTGKTLWQTGFHDHIIRGEANYLRIWQYIDENPLKWAEDCYYSIR